MARAPARKPARSLSATAARISSSPSAAIRNSVPDAAPTIWPASTARVSTSPAVGARMSSRPLLARCCASVACATLTRAAAASRVAALRCRSALEMKPRSTSACARSSSDWAMSRSDAATATWAARLAAVCVWTERSTSASTCPAFTHWPGSTSTWRTSPPSPATPTGMSRRAASEPVAVTSWSTVSRPGTATVTDGGLGAPVLVGALWLPNRNQPIRTATIAAMPPPISRRRRPPQSMPPGSASRSSLAIGRS